MPKLEEQLHELIESATHRMVEYFTMEQALMRISGLDPKGIGCKPDCKCLGCIAREALPK